MDYKTFKGNIITEISQREIFGDAFVDFQKKYKNEDLTNLYGNFTDSVSTDIVKAPFSSPDHNDPVGVYGYPLELIINKPMSIEYGRGMAFLRILRASSSGIDKKLNLQLVTSSEAEKAFSLAVLKYYDIFFMEYGHSVRSAYIDSPHETFLKFVSDMNSSYKTKGNPYGWAIWNLINNDTIYNAYGEFRTIISTKGYLQTKKALMLGYISIEDTATSRENAIIFPAEPSQIIFLRRDAFTVEEIIRLKRRDKKTNQFSKTLNPKLGERPFSHSLQTGFLDLVSAVKNIIKGLFKISDKEIFLSTSQPSSYSNHNNSYALIKWKVKSNIYGILLENRESSDGHDNLIVYVLKSPEDYRTSDEIIKKNVDLDSKLVSKKTWDFLFDYTFKEVLDTIKKYYSEVIK